MRLSLLSGQINSVGHLEWSRSSCSEHYWHSYIHRKYREWRTGLYHDLWKGAVEGTNGFVPVFIPWFTDPTYVEDVPPNFAKTPEEEDLADKYDLSDEQLMFRRRKIAQTESTYSDRSIPPIRTRRSTTGRPIQPRTATEEPRRRRGWKERLALEGEEFVNNRRGELSTYLPHDEGERYVIGADVAMGVRNGDFSVAQVLDPRKGRSLSGVVKSIRTTFRRCSMHRDVLQRSVDHM